MIHVCPHTLAGLLPDVSLPQGIQRLGSFKVALIGTLITFLIMSIMSIFAQNFL